MFFTSQIKPLDVPSGTSGSWTIDRFTVSKDDAIRFNIGTPFSRRIAPGEYTRLKRGSSVVMSDTPAEKFDHIPFLCKAKGRVLINGLGLGMVLNACFDNDLIEHATVVEASEDVIRLSGEHYQKKFGDRLQLVHASAFDYKPPKGVFYDAVWHDIWDNISPDNLPEMTKLKRKYGKRCAWQKAWCDDECRYIDKHGSLPRFY